MIERLVDGRTRAGRGKATPKGRRAGRGSNGAGQHGVGWRLKGIQNGGQNPFYRMHGKIGFRSRNRVRATRVDGYTLSRLNPGKTIDRQLLVSLGLIKAGDRIVKVLNTSHMPEGTLYKDVDFSNKG